jgi:hypothetical protein
VIAQPLPESTFIGRLLAPQFTSAGDFPFGHGEILYQGFYLLAPTLCPHPDPPPQAGEGDGEL